MEIMITLVIVAVLAGLAYPRYEKMVSRSKQTEAKTSLQAIHMGQDLYKISNQKYTDNLKLLDIEIPDDTKYLYSLETNQEGTTFKATAAGNIDGDPTLDEWQINEKNQLVNTTNDSIE